MTNERVIDGVLHRLDGKTYAPMTAQELTARLMEALDQLWRVAKYTSVLGRKPVSPYAGPRAWW